MSFRFRSDLSNYKPSGQPVPEWPFSQLGPARPCPAHLLAVSEAGPSLAARGRSPSRRSEPSDAADASSRLNGANKQPLTAAANGRPAAADAAINCAINWRDHSAVRREPSQRAFSDSLLREPSRRAFSGLHPTCYYVSTANLLALSDDEWSEPVIGTVGAGGACRRDAAFTHVSSSTVSPRTGDVT